MNDRISRLLAAAQAEPTGGRVNWVQYAPIVRALREKGWGYQKIFDWLIGQGEPLLPDKFKEFRNAMSMAAHRLRKSTERKAKA